jgi:hypothetical protein
MFLQFADVDGTSDAIVRFADRFGNLGESHLAHPETPDAPEPGLVGYTLEYWRAGLAAVQRVVGTWRLVQSGEADRLRLHFRQDGRGGRKGLRFVSHPPRSPYPPLGLEAFEYDLSVAGLPPELDGRFDPAAAGRLFCGTQVEEALFHLEDRLRVGSEWDGVVNRAVPTVEADCLLPALWWQTARAVWSDPTFHRCPVCDTWFEVAVGAARSHRRFCSNACRTRAHRGRQDEARRLHADGKTLREIAAALDADPAAVRGWIRSE